MKFGKLILLTIFLIGISLSGCVSVPRHVPVRPIEIKVYDYKTKTPIPGLKVYRVFQTEYYGDSCFFLPFQELVQFNHYVVPAVTDSNGVVQLERHKLKLQCREYFHIETIYINLDEKEVKVKRPTRYPVQKFSWRSWDRLYNPNPVYEGAVVHNTDFKFRGAYGTLSDIYRNIWNEKSLLKESDTLEIYLTPYESD